MASLKHLIAAGPARILGPIYAESFIKINGTDSQILLANGSTISTSTFEPALPTHTSSDSGKALTIDSNNQLQWSTVGGGGGGGGASSLDDLDDVSLSSSKTEGQILRYDATNSLWKNASYSIPSGTCNDSSGTLKTVTINGITELKDGLLIKVKNSSVASASGVTLNVNGLGALPIYFNTNGSWTRIAAHWAANYSFLLMYDTAGDGGTTTAPRWIMVDRDYNTNTNTAVTPTNVTDTTAYRMLLAYSTTYSSNGQPKSTANITGTGDGTINAVKFVTTGGTSSQFVKGDGTLGTYVNILSGSSAPTSDQGSNGDIYIKTV